MAGLSKQEKKAKMKMWKATQNKDYMLTQENVQELFAHLEEQLDHSCCDHTLRYTKQWLKDNIPQEMIESIVAEMTDMGGYCDCEVLFNCYESYDIG